jgi:hypothetical protein
MSGTRFIAAAAALGILLAVPVCRTASARVKTETADNIKDFSVNEVAVLALCNTTGDEKADAMSVYVLEALHEAKQFHVVTPAQFGHDAKRTEVQEDYDRLLRTWQKTNKVDERVLQHVLSATGYDAVLGMAVTKWEEVKIDASQEGTSDTSVGLVLKLFAADGTLLWSASDIKTEHSIAYLPGFNTKSTVGGRAVTTSRSAVPDPPHAEKVAMDLVHDVVATMPKFKKSEAKK